MTRRALLLTDVLTTNTPDFWRRWHISISRWLRDYVLVPLLGDSQAMNPRRVTAALLVTFVLIGHTASALLTVASSSSSRP